MAAATKPVVIESDDSEEEKPSKSKAKQNVAQMKGEKYSSWY